MTNNVMFLMGHDFHYENANEWFKNLDKLIAAVNVDNRVNAFYSTPSLFADSLDAANASWSVKVGDAPCLRSGCPL